MISFQEATDLILAQRFSPGRETVGIDDAAGRVLAENISSDRDYPPFHRSAMDGYALRYSDYATGKEFPVGATVLAGRKAPPDLTGVECIRIMTGAGVPEPLDAVIPREEAIPVGENVSFRPEKIRMGQNIAVRGEDIRKGELALSAGTLIRPAEIMSLTALGVSRVPVFRLPSVSIVTTGEEVVAIDTPPGPLQIRNSNLHVLRAMLRGRGIFPANEAHCHDDRADLVSALGAAVESDIVITTGGVSMGDSDFLPAVLAEIGAEKIFHKVAIRPGKPVWFGRRKSSLIFALPGNPLSVLVGFRIFVEPLLRSIQGMPPEIPERLPAGFEKQKRHRLLEFMPAIRKTAAATVLEQLPSHGSGDILSARGSDGLLIIPEDAEAIHAGDVVDFIPWERG